MAKYTLIQDYVDYPPLMPGIETFAPPLKTIIFSKGTIIDGISYDNGKTISTTIKGALPNGSVGQSLYAIPMNILSIATNNNPNQSTSLKSILVFSIGFLLAIYICKKLK